MENTKNLIYVLSCLSFTIIIGAACYEHLAVVPQWSAGPPASLAMFQGEYGLNAGAFWEKIHPITLLLFVTTLVVFWKSKRRKNVLIALTGYILIMIATFIYFVPELIYITGTEYADMIDETLKHRSQLWERLSLLRLAIMAVLAVVLNLGLTKQGLKNH